MKTGFKGQPIVQGAGHIIGTRDGKNIEGVKCAIYEDSDGILYATAELYKLDWWLSINGCDGYVMN